MRESFSSLSGFHPLLALLVLLASCGVDRTGSRLYAEYFRPEPVGGYAAQRAFVRATEAESSVLQQAITYHREAAYDHAIVAFRNYLDDVATDADPRVFVLAGTAALATGNYDEASEYLNSLNEEDGPAYAEALWYGALNDLQAERIVSARVQLEELSDTEFAAEYPIQKLLAAVRRAS